VGDQVTVASVVYNLAGSIAERANYLKTLVVGQQISPKPGGITETLKEGYLRGPALQLRSFYRWAADPTNYGLIGLPTGNIESAGDYTSPITVEGIVSGILATPIWFTQSYFFAKGRSRYWVLRWIRENRPGDMALPWTYSINAAGTTATLVFAINDIVLITLANPSFSTTAWYLYAYYGVIADDIAGSLISGATTNLAIGQPYPSTAGWTLVDDGILDKVYRRSVIISTTSTMVTGSIETMHHMVDLSENRSWRIDTQMVERAIDARDVFIYAVAGTTEFDALISPGAAQGDFFPFLPIRLNNAFLSETNEPSAYAQVKNAYKKLTSGSRLEALITQLAANPSIGDIDHAYIVLGVSLNTVDNSGKRYLYQFFDDLRRSQLRGTDAYPLWIAEGNTTVESMPTNETRITSTTGLSTSYDIRLQWNFVTKAYGAGLGKPGAKVGDLWFTQQPPITGNDNLQTFRLYWQQTASIHSYLEVAGMIHRNFVYSSYAVETTAWTALDDPKESGFIIPLHYGTWRATPLIQSTQVATFCVYIVFNCYEIDVEEWWETWFFKVIVIVVIAAVSVIFTGGAGLGLLGPHLALGTALGLSGMTAAIAGAVINALAAMILMQLLEPLLSGLGPIGPVVGAVLMFAIGSAASSMQAAGALTINWSDLLRVDNLLALTSAVGQGFTDSINKSTMALQIEALDYIEKAAAETLKIQQEFFKNFGYGAGVIDPTLLIDAGNSPPSESSATFLTRTLMTGSEIAEMSRELLYDFPKYSLTLPDAFT